MADAALTPATAVTSAPASGSNTGAGEDSTRAGLLPADVMIRPGVIDKGAYAQVEVFYGTNRKPTDRPELIELLFSIQTVFAVGCTLVLLIVLTLAFDSKSLLLRSAGVITVLAGGLISTVCLITWYRSASPVGYGNESVDEFTTGRCLVSIPKNHRPGRLESPSVLKGQLRSNPARHVAVLRVDALGRDDAAEQIRGRMAESADGRRRAFVFIHGFNVSFQDAARRTAQMAYDLEFDGAPLFYSWPANGDALLYRVDEIAVQGAADQLREFLEFAAERTGAEEIHLIAHSMGNRALLGALKEVAARSPTSGSSRPRFREIMLTAPDVSESVFRDEIFPAIRGTGERFTLYASANDVALKISRELNGERRLGDALGGVFVAQGLDSVDVSAVDTSLIGHNYYGDNRSVISDIKALIERRTSRDLWNWLMAASTQSGTRFWIFRPSTPTDVAERPDKPTR
jgi:esterase/lipase superfamily enzyme